MILGSADSYLASIYSGEDAVSVHHLFLLASSAHLCVRPGKSNRESNSVSKDAKKLMTKS